MSHDDFEPVPGLPERLPDGEKLLWQGAPAWRSLAVRVFHVRKVAVYFGALAIWELVGKLADGAGLAAAAPQLGWLLLQGSLAVGLLALLAWLSADATVYSITDRRVVLRIGIALPLTVNVPFRIVGSAGARALPDGTTDIAIAISQATRDRISWLHLWPHARPWHAREPQPMLRSVADPRARVVLAQALLDFTGADAPAQPDGPGRQGRPDAEPKPATGAARPYRGPAWTDGAIGT